MAEGGPVRVVENTSKTGWSSLVICLSSMLSGTLRIDDWHEYNAGIALEKDCTFLGVLPFTLSIEKI